MSREEMTELWIARINDYRASGERVAAWSERQQVTSHQLLSWMRELKEADQQKPAADKPKWVAVSLAQTSEPEASALLVRVGTEAVEVRAGFQPAVLAAVVRTLKGLC